MLALAAAGSAMAQQAALEPVPTRDRKIIRRFSLPGDPRGLAFGTDGLLYVGLARPQAVVAIDPRDGAIRRRVVLDSAEIASTKELATLRTNRERDRLFIANGSDESAIILSIPDLAVQREITLEGETVRDALPDPRGRYVFLLGRRVHVFDGTGEKKLRSLPVNDPMAIATSSDGSLLAVLGSEDFGNTKATVVVLFDTATFAEVAREPMQTEERVEAAMFADRDRALVALSREHRFEKSLASRPARPMTRETSTGPMRMTIDFGDLVNSDRICLPEGSGPQIAVLGAADTVLVYAERRCSETGAFSGSTRRVVPASLYGVSAYAIALDPAGGAVAATDRAGFLTIYQLPKSQ